MNDHNDDMEEQVHQLLTESNRVPFLFVGSGMSRRYMGTESWEGLLKWVCTSVGDSIQPFYFYKQRAQSSLGSAEGKNAVYPKMASLMESDFLAATTKVPELSGFVEENEASFESGISPLKIYIANHLKEAKPTMLTDELDLLRGAAKHVSGVITTNYDNLMESIFPKYDVYSREEDLLFSPLSGMGEIYKIHGSMDDPGSMVLDASDYKKFDEHRNYLMAKIFTVFGEYPIVFLGYSMGDQDIKDLLASIASCAGLERAQEMANRFIFVKYSNSPCEPSVAVYNHALDSKRSVTMTQVTTHDFAPIYKAIGRTYLRCAPRVLSQLTRQLFKSNDADEDAENVVFTEFDELDELPEDKMVVVGLSAEDYGKPVSTDQLYEDVVLNDKHFKASLIVQNYLERFLPGNPSGLPMFKYLTKYRKPITEIKTGKLQTEILKRKEQGYESYLNNTQRKERQNRRKKLRQYSVKGLIDLFGESDAYKKLTCLDEQEISLLDLEDYLKKLLTSDNILPKTEFGQIKIEPELRRCIRIYDFLKYGKTYLK